MSDSAAITSLSLEALAQAIRRREISSVEATRASLERMDRHEARINATIAIDGDAALAAAAKADAALARGEAAGPLHGVPLAHKDMFYRRGRISTCGSRIRRNHVPDVTATVLERLDRAGALDLGGLNMSEFAAGPTGHNEHFGDCHNPWNPDHVTGGSSSGSGAAVAARFLPGALGSDTGGSVRLPATMCGVVGLKPTYGLVSRHGCMPRAWSLDCVGPLARTVGDCALLTEVIAGADPRDPSTHPTRVSGYRDGLGDGVAGTRVGVPTTYFHDDLAEDVREMLDASLSVLADLGAEVVEVALPDVTSLSALGDTIAKCEAATIHGKWIRAMPEAYGGHTHTRVEAGFHIPATRYIEALSLRRHHLDRFLEDVFHSVDALHAPVIRMAVPTIEETAHRGAGAVPALVGSITRLTRPISYLGLPSLSVPCGFTPGGLPVGFQLVGAPFSEATLFRIGAAYQEVARWHEREPAGLE